MRQYIPLTPDRHGVMAWTRYTSYQYAAEDALLPIVGPELARAALCLTIAFVPGEGGAFMPVVVLGPEAGTNVYVAPDGRWMAPYVPAELRSHPFRVAATPEGQKVLCVDEASGLVLSQPTGESESFFDEDMKLAPAVRSALDLIEGLEAARPATLASTKALADLGLIQPWSVQLDLGDRMHSLAGLYRVDESAMHALSDDDFLKLRRSGGISMAYAQLLSMQNMATLQGLTRARASVADAGQKLVRDGNLDLSFMESDTLRFS